MCKIRGFTLNHRNALQLNFESMKELVTTNPEECITISNPHQIVRKEGKIISQPQDKVYKLVYTKRRLLPDLTTLPFGY